MIPTPRSLLAALALALWLPACVSGTANVYPGESFAPTDPAEVQVYRFFPEAPSVRVGEVEVTGAAGTDWTTFQDELKKKAASIGGQAVVIVGERSRLAGIYEAPSRFETFRTGGALFRESFFFPGQVYPQEEMHIVGIVLRFPEAPPKPPPAGQPAAPPAPEQGGP
jgi:hypothetical protein